MYYVQTCATCSRCDGDGVIEEPRWQAFWEWYDMSNKRPDQRDMAIKEWFGDDIPPNEEITCPSCGGNGMVVQTILLSDALRDLGVLPKLETDEDEGET